MTAPLVADVRQEVFLQGVLDAALQPDSNFIMDRLVASVNVNEKTGIYHSVPRGQLTRTEAQFRAYGVPAPLTEFNLSRKRFVCDTIELAAPVYDDILNQCPNELDILSMTTQGLAAKIKLKMEILGYEKLWQPNLWTGFAPAGMAMDFDVSDTSQGYSQGCFNLAQSNPILTIRFAQRVCKSRHGLTPRCLGMTEDVFAALQDHPIIVDRIKYSQSAIPLSNPELAKSVMAQALNVDEILVLDVVVEQGAEGQASNPGYLGKGTMVLLYKTNAPSQMTTSAAYKFNYVGDPNAKGGEAGVVRSWREEPTRRRVYEAASSFDYNVVSSDCGVFFKNVLSA